MVKKWLKSFFPLDLLQRTRCKWRNINKEHWKTHNLRGYRILDTLNNLVKFTINKTEKVRWLIDIWIVKYVLNIKKKTTRIRQKHKEKYIESKNWEKHVKVEFYIKTFISKLLYQKLYIKKLTLKFIKIYYKIVYIPSFSKYYIQSAVVKPCQMNVIRNF